MKEIPMEKSGSQWLPDPEIFSVAKHLQIRCSAVEKKKDHIGNNKIPDHGITVFMGGRTLIIKIKTHILFYTPEVFLIRYTLKVFFSNFP